MRKRTLPSADSMLKKTAIRRDLVFRAIIEERRRQFAKWGNQSHDDLKWLAILSEEMGEAAKAALEFQSGELSTDDYREFREELVHVAAVAVAALEDVNQRLSKRDEA